MEFYCEKAFFDRKIRRNIASDSLDLSNKKQILKYFPLIFTQIRIIWEQIFFIFPLYYKRSLEFRDG